MLQRSYPTQHQQLPEWEIPEIQKSSSIPDSSLNHIKALARKCCSLHPANRPNLQEIVEQLCDPEFQLVMDVTTIDVNIGCGNHLSVTSK